MIAVEFIYRAHDGARYPVRVARDGDLFLFLYADIARALMTKSPDRSSPMCDPAQVRRATFENLKNERKCVTLAGLFTCTPASRTDDGTGAASGPAVHFHTWLRAVVLPALESADWPPSKLTLDTLQCGWLESERDKLTQEVQEIRAEPAPEPSAPPVAAPTTVKPAAPRHNTFPDANGFSIDNCDDFLAIGPRH